MNRTGFPDRVLAYQMRCAEPLQPVSNGCIHAIVNGLILTFSVIGLAVVMWLAWVALP